MPIPFDAIAKIISPLVTALIGSLAKHYFEARPKLVTYLVHTSAIPLPGEQNNQVNTHSIVVGNSGKRTAHNLRIGHYFLPDSHQVFPPINHQVIHPESGGAEIIIPTVVPGEQISISYLYFPPVLWNQINCYAKSDECMAKVINVIPRAQPSKATLLILWSLVFVGASTVLYLVLVIVEHWLFV